MVNVGHVLGHEKGAVVLTRASLRATRGFTLIELLTAITLLGILMALGLPSFTAWIANAKVRTVAEGLQTGIRLAQTESVRRNQQVVLFLTNANPDPLLTATAVAGGKNWSIQTVTQFGRAAEFIQGGALADVASGVTITSPTVSICFNSNGRLVTNTTPGVTGAACNASAARFILKQTNSDHPLHVTVSLAGQVRMCDINRTRSATDSDGC